MINPLPPIGKKRSTKGKLINFLGSGKALNLDSIKEIPANNGMTIIILDRFAGTKDIHAIMFPIYINGFNNFPLACKFSLEMKWINHTYN